MLRALTGLASIPGQTERNTFDDCALYVNGVRRYDSEFLRIYTVC